MTLPRETVLELMALADGELTGEEKARAERVLSASSEAQELVRGLRSAQAHVGRWLVEATEERASLADGIADAVMARVAQQATEEGVVVKLTREGRGRRARVAAPAAFAALALAAGVALVFQGGARDAETSAPVASAAVPVVDEPSATAIAAHTMAPALGVEVDEIDTPSGDVSVFEIPAGTAAAAAANASQPSSVVIMIEEDPARK